MPDHYKTEVRLRRAEAIARVAGLTWLQRLCQKKRAENHENEVGPRTIINTQPRTLQAMNRSY